MEIIVVFALGLPGLLNQGQGFVHRIRDVLVIGVQEISQDLRSLVGSDEGRWTGRSWIRRVMGAPQNPDPVSENSLGWGFFQYFFE